MAYTVHIPNPGSIFNNWEFIKSEGSDRFHKIRWMCKCLKCGVIHSWLRATNVKHGQSTQCKSCANRRPHPRRIKPVKIGSKFGEWVFLKEDKAPPGGSVMWKCRCDSCDNVYSLRAATVISGRSSSCRQCARRTFSIPKRGSVFGAWKFIKELKGVPVLWECECKCGRICNVTPRAVVNNKWKQCRFCARKKPRIRPSQFDPMRDKKLMVKWMYARKNAISRCENKKDFNYKNYGKRGIKFDPRFKDKAVFCRYIMTLPGWDNSKLSIDRINNNGHYEPGNLRMATKSMQVQNRRPRNEWSR